jgi:hypothetical protein
MTDFDAQRAAEYFYSRGRRRSSARQIGLLLIALAPLALYRESEATSYVALGSAAWAVLEVAVLRRGERRHTLKGAACQELFDTELLGLPWNETLVDRISPEEVAHAASRSGVDAQDPTTWYRSLATTPDGRQNCQAENPRWSVTIQRRYASTLVVGLGVVLAVGMAIAVHDALTLRSYLLRIAVPSVPAIMSVAALVIAHLEAVDTWQRIERKVAEAPVPSEERLRRQQDLIYLGRSAYPLVPRVFFRLNRPKLEHG